MSDINKFNTVIKYAIDNVDNFNIADDFLDKVIEIDGNPFTIDEIINESKKDKIVDELYVVTVIDYIYQLDDIFYVKDDENSFNVIHQIFKNHVSDMKDELDENSDITGERDEHEYTELNSLREVVNSVKDLKELESITRQLGIIINKYKFFTGL